MVLGLCLILGAVVSPGTRLEPARDGLFLMGLPLVLVGVLLKGLDWMASYTTQAQGSWDHHVQKPGSRSSQRSGRKRRKRLGLFGSKAKATEFAPSGGRIPVTTVSEEVSAPAGTGASTSRNEPAPSVAPVVAAAAPAAPVLKAVSAPAFSPSFTPTPAPTPAPAIRPVAVPSVVPALAPSPVAARPQAVQPTAASAAAAHAHGLHAVRAVAALPGVADPLPDANQRPGQRVDPHLDVPDIPLHVVRTDPGPDTVIEEFVGYDGQDSLVALRQETPRPPRELAWPNPPRTTVVDTGPTGSDVFLDKLMDDVLARIGPATNRVARLAEAPASARPLAAAPARSAADQAPPYDAATRPMVLTMPAPAAYPAPAAEPSAPALAAPPASYWTRETLENADHWRFAALVEKLYQQAGFATQLQAGHTMRGVVVLWLFSRHRPGMPASVVSCVHSPGRSLADEEIVTVADLVLSRGLPRGQLATTAQIDARTQQLAAARGVHLMDTGRLLELITRRSPEQQRALADRLA